MQAMIDNIKRQIADIEYAIKISEGTITGTPFVVELCHGLYLVADGEEGYRGGPITGCVPCYSPERIDAAVAHIVENHGHVFPHARKVYRRDALRTELEAARIILARLQEFVAPVAA